MTWGADLEGADRNGGRVGLKALLGDRLVLGILALGFASGLPLALTGATLRAWMQESGVDIRTIGLFAAVATPYSLKFLWSPLLDRIAVPVLGRSLGHRRGWLVAIQAALAVAVFAMGGVDPASEAPRLAALAVAVAFLSASQDVVIDAFRVELLDRDLLPAGAAAVQFGYRIAMLASGAGALYLATFFGWQATYSVMGALAAAAILVVLALPEPRIERAAPEGRGAAALGAWLWLAAGAPFADFLKRRGAVLVLAFVVTFYLGEAMAGVLSTPFFLALGFTKIEIANVQKIFGTAATMAGLPAGLWLMRRAGLMRALWIAGFAQALGTLLYAALAVAGQDTTMLVALVAMDNFAGGAASACFVAYLSGLCNLEYTATQYALLSSLSSVARTVLATSVGYIQAATGWTAFFVICALAALPGLVLLAAISRRMGFSPDGPEGRSPA